MSRSNKPPAPSAASEAIRVPPHNDEAEVCVLGSVLLDNRLIGLIASQMQAEDFYRESHRHIWRAMCALHAQEQAIDQITLCDELAARHLLEEAGGQHAIGRLSSATPSAAGLTYYLKIVVDDAAQRRALGELYALVDGIYEDTVRAADLAPELARISALVTPPTTARAVGEGSTLAAEWDAWCDESGGEGGTSTGIPELDKLIEGGLHAARSYYIGGLSKQGKTTLCVAVGAHMAARAGWAVEFLSCEMSRPELLTRMIASASRVDIKRYLQVRRLDAAMRAGEVRMEDLTELDHHDLARLEEWTDSVEEAKRLLTTSPLRLTQQALPSALDFYHQVQARQLQLAAQGRDPEKLFVVADYLQSFRTGQAKIDADEFARVAAVTQRLNAISKDCNVPIFIPFQFGREAERAFADKGKQPTFADARGASQISNDANHMLIYLRPFWREQSERAGYVKLTSELSRTVPGQPVAHLLCDMARQRYAPWMKDQPSDEELEQMASGTKTTTRGFGR